MLPVLPDDCGGGRRVAPAELARLADSVVPAIEALRSLTTAPFRAEIALMVERLGHTVVNEPTAPNLVTIKDGRKTVITCARPTDQAPAGIQERVRLNDAVIAASAQAGIFVTTRNFTADARAFAASLSIIPLVDGVKLIASLRLSKAAIAAPTTYRAMCRQCGDIVQHRLDKPENVACSKGHQVAPTIAPTLLERRKAADHDGEDEKPMPGPLTRRQKRAHNYRVRGRALKREKQRREAQRATPGEEK